MRQLQTVLFFCALISTTSLSANNYLYWASIEGIGVSRSSLEAPEIESFSNTSSSRGISVAVDTSNQKVYRLMSGTNAGIRVSDFDGNEDEVVFQLGDAGASDLVLDESSGVLYWLTREGVFKGNVDGTGLIMLVGGINNPRQIDIDVSNGHVFYVADLRLSRVDMDGSNLQVLLTGLLNTEVLAVDEINQTIYVDGNQDLVRVDTDGNNLTTLVDPILLRTLQIIDDTLYFNLRNDTEIIISADLDGMNQSIYASFTDLSGVDHYFIDQDNSYIFADQLFGQQLVRTNLDGENTLQLMANTDSTHDVEVIPETGEIIIADQDFDNIIITDSNGLRAKALSLSLDNNGGFIQGLAFDADQELLFWAENSGGVIGRIGLDGSNQTQLITGLTKPTDLTIDPVNQKIYWTENAGASGNTGIIGVANYDGSGVQTIFNDVSNGIRGIDLDVSNQRLYFTDSVNDRIWRSDVDGSNLMDIIITSARPHDVAIDTVNGVLYWTEGFGSNNNPTASIRCSDLDGNNPEDFLTGLGGYIRDLNVANVNDIIFVNGFDAATSNCPVSTSD